jgi:hypothetical protein
LCKCIFQSAAAGGPVGKQVHEPTNEQGLEVQNGISCQKGIPISCPFLWMKNGGEIGKGSSANKFGFRPM